MEPMTTTEYKIYLRSRYLDVLYKHRDDSEEEKEVAIAELYTGTWRYSFESEHKTILDDLRREVGLNFYARKWKIVTPFEEKEEDWTWLKEMEDQLVMNMLVDAASGET